MTSRAFLAFALAVVVASGVGTAALLDQQPSTSPAPVVPAPAVDVDLDLDAILAAAAAAVEQSVDADSIARKVEQAMQQAHIAAGAPRLGIAVRDVTADEARQAGLDGISGTWVTRVTPESAAARAGLAEGDIIVRVDGQDVRSARHLTRIVSETPVGRTVPVDYLRAGQRGQVTVTPDSAPAMTMRGMRDIAPRIREPLMMAMGRARGRLGLSVQDLTPQLAEYFGVTAGVLVTQVHDGSPAARAGMKAGDVITRIDTSDVTRASDVFRAVATLDGGASVKVELTRDRQTQSLSVTLDARPTRGPARTRPRTPVSGDA